ncbi:MAG: class I SAM-dependent methyltransferase [Gammaproteobacteria bacterium]|nr:class I SAM-dependent methyltransferase [Gammaproteobacteria bacterium]MBT5051796.1 class I SAM-dependent methyltransferase [Gammaproteobacteria bacterium]
MLPTGLALVDHYRQKPPLSVDYGSPSLRLRQKKISAKGELLVRAVKEKPGARVLDMTAGLGTDAFILASYGHDVTMLERSKTVYLLVKDALKRARQDAELKPVVARLTLHHWDSTRPFLPAIGFDAALVDPMFDEKKKSALPPGNMQMLQAFLGRGAELQPFLTAAQELGIRRTIVKRPRLDRAPAKNAVRPVYQLTGRSSRLDVFFNQV